MFIQQVSVISLKAQSTSKSGQFARDGCFTKNSFGPSTRSRVLIKCRQPAKKPDTWRFEPSTFGGNMVSRGSENLKLPKKHNWQAVYFNILAVHCKT